MIRLPPRSNLTDTTFPFTTLFLSDTGRNRPELTENILEMLQWLGLGWDGEPTYQSQRFDSYTAAADRLLADGRAYWCDCTAEEVQARAKERGGDRKSTRLNSSP